MVDEFTEQNFSMEELDKVAREQDIVILSNDSDIDFKNLTAKITNMKITSTQTGSRIDMWGTFETGDIGQRFQCSSWNVFLGKLLPSQIINKPIKFVKSSKKLIIVLA